MASLELVLDIRDFSGKIYDQLLKVFSNTTFPYEMYNSSLNFTPSLKYKVKTLKGGHEFSDIKLSFSSEMAAEIDLDDNQILYYDGPKNHDKSEISVKKLRKFFRYDVLDEDFLGEIELFCVRMTHTIILTMPWIDINMARFTVFLNQKEYISKTFIDQLIHKESYNKWPCLFKSKLNIMQTWNWLNKNNIHDTDNSLCPVVSILSYILNRDYHEILLYSVIGLEALFGNRNNNRGISFTLQNRIHKAFPVISMEQIKKIYKARSSVTHGDAEIGTYNLLLELMYGNFKFREEAILASAIFIETIRMLIANNAKKMIFKEKLEVDYSFE